MRGKVNHGSKFVSTAPSILANHLDHVLILANLNTANQTVDIEDTEDVYGTYEGSRFEPIPGSGDHPHCQLQDHGWY